MNIKSILFSALFTFVFTFSIFSQQNLTRIGTTEESSWKIIPEKSIGSAVIKNGILALSSDSDLFYICEKVPALRNVSVAYNIRPENEESHTGVLLRYVSPQDWIYVGCDLTTDIFGYSAWFVETPHFRKEIARDIAKLYKNYTRNIRIDCVDEAITLRIDNEIAAQVNLAGLGVKAGKIGFRVQKGGSAVISDIVYKELTQPMVSFEKETLSIRSENLKAILSNSFPTPLTYQWKAQSTVVANNSVCKYVNLNGDLYPVKGSGKQIDASTVRYLLEVPDVKINMEVECHVQGDIFETKIIRLQENGNLKVKTINFPCQYLASVANSDKDAMLSLAINEGSDRFFHLNSKEQDTINYSAAIVILNNDKLAISLDNNSIYECKQFVYRCDKNENATFIGNNEWIYRGIDGKITELPWSKVIFADDRNEDGKVTWQDGAVALSEIYPDPYGVDRVRNSNITITMNFASEAQFPFLRQLDNIKKIYFLTDGFRQMLELKGYQSEGHDSGHPDYAGHYNVRAGGLKDLKTLVDEAKHYNAYIGLHINDSEAHPESKAYNDSIVTGIPAWKWLDQAYLINKELDVTSGSFQQRLDNLKKEVDGLDFIYIDTYREHRYLAYNTAKLFNERGWAVWTEDPSVFNRYGVWIHYHPESKSLISRFIHGTRKDAFAADSLFGGGYDRGASLGFQGWQNGKDMYAALRNFYTIQLPYRCLMQSPVIYADSSKLRFKNGTETRYENGITNMYDNGRLIKTGNIVFIPWDYYSQEKIYHYNPEGGSTSWQLPASWKEASNVFCYQLTDTGRLAPIILPVINNRVTLNAKKDIPYVIYKTLAPDLLSADWSHGSSVKDMGFDSKSFNYWEKTGDKSGVQIGVTSYGQSELKITGQKKAGVTQLISGLEGGKSYSVYVWVQINGKRKALLEVSDYGGSPVNATLEETLVKNTQINSDKRGGNYELLRVQFTLPKGKNTAKLNLYAEAVKDTSSVVFDDVRFLETRIKQKEGYVYYEDFEDVDFGWGGWMLLKPSEAKTHLSERNKDYTNDVINGNWSLKMLDQGIGKGIRTIPSFIHFAPHTKYQVSFLYRSSGKGSFQLDVRSSRSDKILFSALLGSEGLFEGSFQTDEQDDYYISITQLKEGMLILDDFGIKKTKKAPVIKK